MNITVSGKQMKLTEGIRNYIDLKLSGLEKYLDPSSEVKVTVSTKNDTQKIEVTIIPINGSIVRAEEVQDDLYVALDMVYDKLCIQLEKYKNRKKYKPQNNKSIEVDEQYILNEEEDFEDDNITIERRKKFNMKPMSPEEAILQMELIGHKFYMFRNQYTEEINVAYKRESGGYGIIEHE